MINSQCLLREYFLTPQFLKMFLWDRKEPKIQLDESQMSVISSTVTEEVLSRVSESIKNDLTQITLSITDGNTKQSDTLSNTIKEGIKHVMDTLLLKHEVYAAEVDQKIAQMEDQLKNMEEKYKRKFEIIENQIASRLETPVVGNNSTFLHEKVMRDGNENCDRTTEFTNRCSNNAIKAKKK